MKYTIIIIALLLVSCVYAVDADDACVYKGYFGTAATYVYDNNYIKTYEDTSYTTSVTGSARKINWTSNPAVAALVYRSNNRTYAVDGGLNGTIPKTVLSHDIDYVAFCTASQIPEYGVLGVVMISIAAVFYLWKKRLG